MNENTGANAEIRELIARYREVIEGLQKSFPITKILKRKEVKRRLLKASLSMTG